MQETSRPLTPSPFPKSREPEPNGSVLKCKVSPAGVIAWWGYDKIMVGISKAEADLLVQTLRDFVDQYVKPGG